MCDETFTCQQNQEEHKELGHGLNAFIKCNIVLIFLKWKSMKSDIKLFRQTPLFKCKECGKITDNLCMSD